MSIIKQLKKSVSDSNRVLTSEVDLYSFSFDASFGIYKPDIVCQPLSTQEVVNIVNVANSFAIPIVPRGRGTGLSGGSLPVEGGIVLDFSLWDTTLDMDLDDLLVTVSPGVITAMIDQKANEYSLMYPPDPSSAHVSTIGGNIAENAGGPRGLKYGVTGDFVLGLEVVTATGEVIQTGGKTVKNVTGYDLTSLLVGSEGTLGIITEAILRLVPKPQANKTAMVLFDDLVDAGKVINQIICSGIVPAKMEIMDQQSLIVVEQYAKLGLPIDVDAILLIELDGHPVVIEEEMVQVQGICRQSQTREIIVAQNNQEAKELWQTRKLVSAAIAKIKPTKISEDATVPRSKIPEMFAGLKEIREKYNIELVVFGHAGDGNLHPNIMTDERELNELKRVEQAVEEIFALTVRLGGTLSGEHGIGTMKSPFLEMELGKDTIQMMKLIKHAWDPKNILNPGKIFPKPNQKFTLR